MRLLGGATGRRLSAARLGSYLCSLVGSTLEQVASGRPGLDLLVVPPTCDAIRGLGAILARDARPPCRTLALPQNARSPHALPFLRSEYARLLAELEELSGRRVGEEALRAAAADGARSRELLAALRELRALRPAAVSVDEAFVLARAGTVLPVAEHNALLEAALAGLERRRRRERWAPRVLLVGAFCQLPSIDLLRLVARSCHVVDDDLLAGMSFPSTNGTPGDDPLTALARAGLESPLDAPVRHRPLPERVEELVRRARFLQADGVLLAAPKMCEPGLDEQAGLAAALSARGVPTFVCELDESMTGSGPLALQLETFVENLGPG